MGFKLVLKWVQPVYSYYIRSSKQ